MKRWLDLAPGAITAYGAALFVMCIAGRLAYPYDLEWMEGGMLAHAWRLERGLPLYTEPTADWIPYVYPPGYSALLAALPGDVSYTAARLLSWMGSLGAVTAMIALVGRQGRSWSLGVVAGLLFLATFRSSGGFLDLARPDAVAIGLAAWAIALALDGRRGTDIAGGLLLCAAFTVKHNFAAFGVPLALALWAWRGWRVALRFGLWSAVPALLMTGLLQWRSGGGFLTYLIEVPSSHPMQWARALPGAPGELGHWLGFVLITGALSLTATAHRKFTDVHPAVGVVTSLIGGLVAAGYAVSQPPVAGSATPHEAVMALTFFALGALLGSAVIATLSSAVERKVDGPWWAGFGLFAMAMFLASLMRAHNGGFINVLIPAHWVIISLAAVALGQLRHHYEHVAVYALGAAVMAAQGAWLISQTNFDQVVPNAADRAAGQTVLAELGKRCDGPIFSPYASWLPVQAGQAPSLHLIALWDVDHKQGPMFQQVQSIRKAVTSHHYACVLEAGRQPLPYNVPKAYAVTHRFQLPGLAMKPKTGWPVRPRTLLVPK